MGKRGAREKEGGGEGRWLDDYVSARREKREMIDEKSRPVINNVQTIRST